MQPGYVPESTIARSALVGVALYAVIDVALVFLRPEFSVLHNAESDYGSAGSWAWLMDVNFLVRFLLSLAVVVSLASASRKSRRSNAAFALLTVWAVASGLLAVFPDDPVGAATRGTGRIHLAVAFIAFVAVLVGAILATTALGRQQPWRRLRLALLLLSWGAIVPLVLLGRSGFRPDSLGGLYEKVFLAMELAWLVLAAAPVARAHASGRIDPLHHHRPAVSARRR